ncbi:hypothetical protein EST38_g3833 [Candolleomyces aberdarensis]|uniref:Ribosomal RNA-processing protein 17 n=1 Tax=Candolleomyces aberdarensis TaxID=2316362 RepID=A0A4Q2DPK6_9AGAR|nr:hypothetical protein EST38_g3833 [Candolleomyces aberdarensis]
MASSNLARLTRAHSAVAAKRHAKRRQLAEVVFDDEARREFLTGFHKRKKAKTEAARKKAKEREKQERLQDRRERRQALREQAQENAHKVEQAYAAAILGDAVDDDDAGNDDEWHGVTPSSGTEKDAQYQGEEVVATVTVVEDFDPSTLTTAEPVPAQETSEEFTEPNSTSKPPSSHEKPPQKLAKRKVKEKKIYYETKQARKHQREKQRGRKLEKAERAGGKAARQKRVKR